MSSASFLRTVVNEVMVMTKNLEKLSEKRCRNYQVFAKIEVS